MQTATILDVRSVAPMHRFDTIMSAYESLADGEVMQLIVDHDPKCMYYTLEATRQHEQFSFEYLEAGPDTWRVLISRRRI